MVCKMLNCLLLSMENFAMLWFLINQKSNLSQTDWFSSEGQHNRSSLSDLLTTENWSQKRKLLLLCMLRIRVIRIRTFYFSCHLFLTHHLQSSENQNVRVRSTFCKNGKINQSQCSFYPHALWLAQFGFCSDNLFFTWDICDRVIKGFGIHLLGFAHSCRNESSNR